MPKRAAVVAVLACLVLAGCNGPLTESGGTESEPTDTPEYTRAIAAPVETTAAATGTTDGATTTESSAATNGSISTSDRNLSFEFPRDGPYEASVEVDGETATRRWNVTARDPDDALSVHVSADSEVYVEFVAI